MTVYLLKLRPAGMFSNVNEVIQQIHIAKQKNYQFVIDWSNSCYKTEKDLRDPWAYYFEAVWPDLQTNREGLETLVGGEPVACAKNNIVTPRLTDGICNPLLLPTDRNYPATIIRDHIRLNHETSSVVDHFYSRFFSDNVIGLHIRGPGRIQGGAKERRALHGSGYEVPFQVYFQEVDAYLETSPNAQIFACSDSSQVMEAVKDKYKERLISYEATRSEFGEMHAGHPSNSGQTFDTKKLGLDVLVEAHLLARCSHLIHGNSNVANFILCKSPLLSHTYVQA